MKITKVEKTNEKVKYFVNFNHEEWQELKDQSFNLATKQITITGFRKGHVPLDVARKNINESEIFRTAVDKACKKVHKEILLTDEVNKQDIFFESLMFDIGNMDDELELICEFNLLPKVELPDYKNSKINFKVDGISESEIDSYINELIKKDVVLTPKEGDVIENGDVVVFDFKGKIDNQPFPGGEANFYELEIGSNQFIPGFEKQMIGLKKDEKKTIVVNFPDSYHAKEFAGKAAEFDLNIRDIKISKKPELDEEYIKSLNIKGVSNKEELTKHISNKLTNEKKVENERINLNLFYEYIKNNSKLSYIPDFLIDKEKANLKNHFSAEAQKHKLSLNEYLEKNMHMSNDTEENLKQLATQNIVLIYSLREILKDLNITISDQDVENYYEIMASTFNMHIEQIKKMFANNENIKEVILQNKLIDKIIELNK